MAEAGDVVAKCTIEEFDKALVHVLGKGYADFIKSRTHRQNMAIIKIFMDGLEHLPKYKESCAVIRDGAISLSKNGYYSFKQ